MNVKIEVFGTIDAVPNIYRSSQLPQRNGLMS